MSEIIVRSMALGPVGANCYFAYVKESDRCIIIDAPGESDRIIKGLCGLSLVPEAVLLTHSHFDHIGAADALRERYRIPVCCHEAEKELLMSPAMNLTEMTGRGYGIKPDRTFADGQEFSAAGIKIRVIHTPGHTAGGACYYLWENGIIFSGDTLFYESVGRTDFPTGSMNLLISSIKEKLMILPEETVVYPGHNESTDIGHERRHNPYLL